MATYVLVHGAWHSGRELKAVATLLGSAGHAALTPTIRGNGLEDPKTVGLDEAIRSIEAYLIPSDNAWQLVSSHILAMFDRPSATGQSNWSAPLSR